MADQPTDIPFPGVRRMRLDTDVATIARYDFDPGARFPLHRHPQHQITIIEAGDVRMLAGAESRSLSAGAWSLVGAQVPHAINAGERGATVLAIVVPARASDELTFEDR